MKEGRNRGNGSDEWQTPTWLFQALDREFYFTLDGAATPQNALCRRFCAADAAMPWSGERVFCNPPYSNIEPFVKAAFDAEIAVLLLPVRTDSDWFQMLIERRAEIRWFRKRVNFIQNGEEVKGAPFPPLIAIVKAMQP